MPKPNTGSLNRNANKQKDTHPDAKGSCNIDGIEYWISGWIKISPEDGSKWTSLSFTKKEEKQERKIVNQKDVRPASRPARDQDLDPEDSIPF